MVNWIGLAFPFIYLGILVGALSTFSSLYRKRKLWRSRSLAPWFGPHRQRDIYLSLLHIDPETSSSAKVPDSLLKAALLRRAIEDVRRIIEIRSTKHALAQLLQRGSIGDDLWQRFLRAEQEMEEEIRDVVGEANAFAEGWGSIIFQSANEMAQNQQIRKTVDGLQSQTEAEKEWWEKRRANIQSDFMKELDQESQPVKSVGKASDDEVVMVESGGPAVTQQGTNAGKKKKKGKN